MKEGISVIKKLNVILTSSFLLIIYKLFIRPHLDYMDVIYEQPNNNGLPEKVAALVITAAIRGT